MHSDPVWKTKMPAEEEPSLGSLSLDVRINYSVQLFW